MCRPWFCGYFCVEYVCVARVHMCVGGGPVNVFVLNMFVMLNTCVLNMFVWYVCMCV